MPKSYPKEFREDVISVARNRESETTLAQVAKDFGLHEDTLREWLRQADLDAGNTTGRVPGPTTGEKPELRELRRRNRVLEQEVKGMRRTAVYFG